MGSFTKLSTFTTMGVIKCDARGLDYGSYVGLGPRAK